MSRPLIAATMGDASGIGPELLVRVADDDSLRERCRLVVLGDPAVMEENAARLGRALTVVEVPEVEDPAADRPGVIAVLPLRGRIGSIRWGQSDTAAARAALEALQTGAELMRAGRIGGLLSAPVNKQELHLVGMSGVDELELLAELTGSAEPMLVGVIGELLSACVTLHVPLREVPGLITRARVLHAARALLRALRKRGAVEPRIAIAGLNPHAGDGGLLGSEEREEIEPAIRALRAEGAAVEGPVAPDALFPLARERDLQGVLCMYHDQANIARKLSGRQGATLFLGLPVPVGTTAHGTAYDLAGEGIADPISLRVALDQVIRLAVSAS